MTRTTQPTPTQTTPRNELATGQVTERSGAAVARATVSPSDNRNPLSGWRDDQQRDDHRYGIEIARKVQILLQGPDLNSILAAAERTALSPRAAVKLGVAARLAQVRLGYSIDEIAQALTRLLHQDPNRRLSHATRTLRHDLRHHPAMPGAGRRARRRAKADARRAQQLSEIPTPAFVRTDPYSRPITWTPDGPTGTHYLACTTLPHNLDNTEIRRAIHAAAHRAAITGPQLVEAERRRTHSALDPDRFTLDELLTTEQRLRGNGCIHLIALDGSGAIVPPETSTATTVRWTTTAAPTDEQHDLYRWLLNTRDRQTTTPPPRPQTPSTFTDMWNAIGELLTELNFVGDHGHQPHTTPATARGRQLLHQHGSRAKALFATHPDRGGNPDDFRAVLAALGRPS